MNYAFAGDSFHFGKTHTKRRANWRWHSGAEPIPACWEEEGGPLAMEARNSARLARDAEGQISTVKLPSSFPRATREHTMNSRSPWSLPPLSVTLKIRRGGAARSSVAQVPHAPAAGRVACIVVQSSPNQKEFDLGARAPFCSGLGRRPGRGLEPRGGQDGAPYLRTPHGASHLLPPGNPRDGERRDGKGEGIL